MTSPPPIRFTTGEAHDAADEWGFSCAPAAICALFKLTPAEVRPHLGDFKGYMTPSAVFTALRGLGARWQGRKLTPKTDVVGWSAHGLGFVQWGGPWCRPGVPIRARYRYTHWVASWRPPRHYADRGVMVFDINALDVGGWLPLTEWSGRLVPWLLEGKSRADGRWWLAQAVEVWP